MFFDQKYFLVYTSFEVLSIEKDVLAIGPAMCVFSNIFQNEFLIVIIAKCS